MFKGFSQITTSSGHLGFIGFFSEVNPFGISRLLPRFHGHGGRFFLVEIGVKALLLVALVMGETLLFGLIIGNHKVLCVIYSPLGCYRLPVYLEIPRCQISSKMVHRLFCRVAWSCNIYGTQSPPIHELGFLIILYGKVTPLTSLRLTSHRMCYRPKEMSTLCTIYFSSQDMFHATHSSSGLPLWIVCASWITFKVTSF